MVQVSLLPVREVRGSHRWSTNAPDPIKRTRRLLSTEAAQLKQTSQQNANSKVGFGGSESESESNDKLREMLENVGNIGAGRLYMFLYTAFTFPSRGKRPPHTVYRCRHSTQPNPKFICQAKLKKQKTLQNNYLRNSQPEPNQNLP